MLELLTLRWLLIRCVAAAAAALAVFDSFDGH
jgi:hypothetical protein